MAGLPPTSFLIRARGAPKSHHADPKSLISGSIHNNKVGKHKNALKSHINGVKLDQESKIVDPSFGGKGNSKSKFKPTLGTSTNHNTFRDHDKRDSYENMINDVMNVDCLRTLGQDSIGMEPERVEAHIENNGTMPEIV